MQTKGVFIFKSLEKKDGGKFTNADGKEIEYKESALLKFDEVTKDKTTGKDVVNERYLKIRNINESEEKKELVNKLDSFKLYERIELSFELVLTKDGCVLNLFDANKVSK